MRPNIQGSDGETRHEYSDSCVKCMGARVTSDRDAAKVADFDENGWFFAVNFQCQNPKCAHKWVEKFRIRQ